MASSMIATMSPTCFREQICNNNAENREAMEMRLQNLQVEQGSCCLIPLQTHSQRLVSNSKQKQHSDYCEDSALELSSDYDCSGPTLDINGRSLRNRER